MTANAITFLNPTPKIYDVLPPPVSDLDEVLAFIYTGPCKPTQSDFEHTPLLVRRNKVGVALNWLKLNHCDYWDLEISETNLKDYPENGIPVVIDYQQAFTNKSPESTSVHDNEVEAGTDTGKCPFVVHGLTGKEYSTKSLKAIKAIALKHLTSDGRVLAHFPLIAFNHEQMKEATTGGYLLATKPNFENIVQRLMDTDTSLLNNIARKMDLVSRPSQAWHERVLFMPCLVCG
jgi:hypothetical protein